MSLFYSSYSYKQVSKIVERKSAFFPDATAYHREDYSDKDDYEDSSFANTMDVARIINIALLSFIVKLYIFALYPNRPMSIPGEYKKINGMELTVKGSLLALGITFVVSPIWLAGLLIVDCILLPISILSIVIDICRDTAKFWIKRYSNLCHNLFSIPFDLTVNFPAQFSANGGIPTNKNRLKLSPVSLLIAIPALIVVAFGIIFLPISMLLALGESCGKKFFLCHVKDKIIPSETETFSGSTKKVITTTRIDGLSTKPAVTNQYLSRPRNQTDAPDGSVETRGTLDQTNSNYIGLRR